MQEQVHNQQDQQEGRPRRCKLAEVSLMIYKQAVLKKLALPTEHPVNMEYLPSKAPSFRGFPPFNLVSSNSTMGIKS